MLSVEIRVRGDHLRLEPDTEFKTDFIHFVNQIFQAAFDLLFVDNPVTEGRIVFISFSEPAVIHNKHLDAVFFCLSCDIEELIGIKIKVSCFPVVNQNRAFFVVVRAADHMSAIKCMVGTRHFAKSLGRVDHNNLRRLEFIAGF